MKKIIALAFIIGLFFISSISTAYVLKIENRDITTEFTTIDPNLDIMLYKVIANKKIETSVKSNFDAELLWENSDDVGLCYFTSMFSRDINGDDFPDALTNHSALDGFSGELIWKTEKGKVCGVGDINNDGIDEVISKKQGGYISDYSDLYCLDSTDGSLIWTLTLNCTLIYNIVIGDLVGDSNNEIIVPTGDWVTRNNQKVYCLNGMTGEIIWEKHTINRAICAAIDDVNNDGETDVLVSNWEKRLYCLNSENGTSIWEVYGLDNNDYRTIVTGDLNEDPYKEIIVESGYGVRCFSGYNGSSLWRWQQQPDAGWLGSFQSMKIADMIQEIPGNEVIATGSCGAYCLRGGNNYTNEEREIWHAGIENGQLPDIVMSSDLGDLDQDGLLDVASITTWYGNVYAIDGQEGTRLWKYAGCGTEDFYAIVCADVTGDNHPEVIAKDDAYVCALLSYSLPNQAPQTPIIKGETSGRPGVEYDYTFITTDSDGDDMFYFIDWGDNTTKGWFGPFSTGESIIEKHSWAEIGTYKIKAKTRDIHGAESEWGTLNVTIKRTRTINSLFFEFLKNNLRIFPLLLKLLRL